jgi:hypothetical protein
VRVDLGITAGTGGSGGGGNGGTSGTSGVGGNGQANLGAGGGGGSRISSGEPLGGNGGSGVVIIKYPDFYTATFSAGITQSTSTSGGFKVSTITATSTTSETVSFGL